jgi:hypothetical protein
LKLKSIYYFFCILFLFSSCGNKAAKEYVICTQIPVDKNTEVLPSTLYPEGARLVLFEPEHPSESFKVLSSEFYSACAPDAFYTGNKLVFAGKKSKEDLWQIYEINLRNFKIEQITNVDFNCASPMFLPTGEIVFSGEKTIKSITAHVLYKCTEKGEDLQQITFHPHTDYASSILRDGRILFLSKQEYPKQGEEKLMAMRPDGTKAELFYQNNLAPTILGRAWETVDNKIVFTEKVNEVAKSSLTSLSYNNPFHSKEIIGKEAVDFWSVYPLSANKYLVSAKNQSTTSGVYFYDVSTQQLQQKLLEDTKFHTVQAIINQVKPRARKLPSAVNLHKSTGLVLCQDIHHTQLEDLANNPKDTSLTVELAGINKIWGRVSPEKDGSIYVKVQADMPFQFRVLNSNGELVHGPSDWLWVRPNERRGCVGCHADPLSVPKNYVPLAVKDKPAAISVNSLRKEASK